MGIHVVFIIPKKKKNKFDLHVSTLSCYMLHVQSNIKTKKNIQHTYTFFVQTFS